jgi:Tol biopolymer transport system component
MNIKRIARLLNLWILVFLLQTACTSQVMVEPAITATLVENPKPIDALTSTVTLESFDSLTPTPTVEPTWQAWHATALAIYQTEREQRDQSRDEMMTQVAQFPKACEGMGFNAGSLSPDGKWFAASCSNKSDQSSLIVQNRDGAKWILDFKDYLSPKTPVDMSGFLHPKFWSPDGNYLYFTNELGYDGGGDYCFPDNWWEYGLFRLDLSTGAWSTVVPSTNAFPGYAIEFSPTGRRFAITQDGVTITDLQTGVSAKIAIQGTVEGMIWSPDGKYLAYSSAICDSEKIISSTMVIRDVTNDQSISLFKEDGKILKPEEWVGNSTLRVIGEEIVDFDSLYTIYVYSIEPNRLLFNGTATPGP